jgi:hypothetical protein
MRSVIHDSTQKKTAPSCEDAVSATTAPGGIGATARSEIAPSFDRITRTQHFAAATGSAAAIPTIITSLLMV